MSRRRNHEPDPARTEAWQGHTLPELTALTDRLRHDRGLPDDVMAALLNDMAIFGRRARGWACGSWWSVGLACPHNETRRTRHRAA